MACKFICDGCGAEAPGEFANGQWFKPRLWFQRSDKDGPQTVCSRPCIDTVSERTGKTSVVAPF